MLWTKLRFVLNLDFFLKWYKLGNARKSGPHLVWFDLIGNKNKLKAKGE